VDKLSLRGIEGWEEVRKQIQKSRDKRRNSSIQKKTRSIPFFVFFLLSCFLLTEGDVSGEKKHLPPASERILIKFKKPGGNRLRDSTRMSLESEFGLQRLKRFDLIDVHLYRTLGDRNQTIVSLRQSGSVEYVEPDYPRYATQTIPNDPRFGTQWGLKNSGQEGGTVDADIDGPEAWVLTTGSPSVVVAVIDSGIEYNHEDLRPNMWVNPGEIAGNGFDDDGNGYVDDIFGIDAITGSGDPLDDDGHGTHVAGIIAAVGNNGIGVSGVCWTCRIMALKFLPSDGSGSISDEIECIQYAVNHGAQIINGSFGDYSFSQAEKEAIDAAGKKGVLFIFAAGNQGNDNDVQPHFPSSLESENIVAVGISDRNDELASFSDFGLNSVDLAAPGLQILSTGLNNSYRLENGTSVATPHVTGIAALLKAYDPDMSWLEIEGRLIGGVDVHGSMAGTLLTGGRVNAFNALTQGQDRILHLQTEKGGTTSPGPGRYSYPAGEEIALSALPDPGYEFDGWGGSVDPNLRLNNPLSFKLDVSRVIVANFKSVIYPPLLFSGKRQENRSLSQKETINILTWHPNPLNVEIVNYKLYQIRGGSWSFLASIVSTSFEYVHRNVREDQVYFYALVAVNRDGQEGLPAFLTVQ